MNSVEVNSQHVKMLKAELEKRKAINNRYSLRAFAKFLEIDHSTLSQIFSGHKGLSEKKSLLICKKLEFSHMQCENFINSVIKQFARSPEKRIKAKKRLEKLHLAENIKVLKSETVQNINHWSFLAVYELILTKRCQTIPSLVKTLNLPEEQITHATTMLEKLSVIYSENGKLFAHYNGLQSLNDIPSEAIKQFHASTIEKAKEALLTQALDEREFQTAIFSFPADKMELAKQSLRNFIQNFNIDFNSESPNSQVYSITVNFFRIEKAK